MPPKWQQVLDDLERRIDAGEFSERFPTDRELVETYGVSRHTVREAVRRLRTQGVVERHRGRGSFLAGRGFTQPVGTLYSLFRAVESQGLAQHSEVLSLDLATDAEAAAALGLDPGTAMVRLERRRMAGDEPLALDIAWLPSDLATPLLDVDFSRTALYDELEDRCGIQLTGGDEVIESVAADARQRRLLDLDRDEALLRVQRRGLVGTRVVEWRVSLIRGRRFALVSTLDPTREDGGLQVRPR